MQGGQTASAQRSASRREAKAGGLLTALYTDYSAPLRNYLTTILKSQADAEDVLQDAFLRLHRCEDLTAYGNPRAVLYKTAYRLALNLIRKRRSNVLDRAMPAEENVIATPSEETSAEEALISTEQEAIYTEALDQLSPRCRQVIELRTVSELSFKEISDTLGLSVSTLEKHLTRGKRQCAEMVAGWHAAAAAA